MGSVNFNEICPVCKGKMAEKNKYCSSKCADNALLEDEPVRSWNTI